jgi:hypothetical protein
MPAADANSLRDSINRIVYAPPGGGSTTGADQIGYAPGTTTGDATSAGTGQGPVNLGTTARLSNVLPPPGSSPQEKELAAIRAQTALLQQQTEALLKAPPQTFAPLPPLPLPPMPALPAPPPALPSLAASAAAPKPISTSVGGKLTTTTPTSRAAATAAVAPAPAPVALAPNPLTSPLTVSQMNKLPAGTPAQVVTVGSGQVYNPTTGTYA